MRLAALLLTLPWLLPAPALRAEAGPPADRAAMAAAASSVTWRLATAAPEAAETLDPQPRRVLVVPQSVVRQAVAARIAGFAPLLDVSSVPGLGPNGQAELARTLLRNLPRAFAIGPGGAYAARSGNAPPAEIERLTLAACQSHTPDHAPCRLWLRDQEIVWPGRLWSPPAPPEAASFRGEGRETVPDERFLWWGPLAARGALLWAHGRTLGGADGPVDSRGRQPQAWIRHFNNAGYDVWRFDRDPATDFLNRSARLMRQDLGELRRRGYRRLVVAGQSRGGWNALQALDTPGLAEVHIAIAPAALGMGEADGQARQLANLRTLIGRAGASRARVAVANFRGDPFDGLPEDRATALRGLEGRVGAFLLIDRPEGLSGHGAGASPRFAERFGGCLLRFATAPVPSPGC